MKTLGKLKLNQFSKAELDQRALNALKGGCNCSSLCSCSCSGGNIYTSDATYNYSGSESNPITFPYQY